MEISFGLHYQQNLSENPWCAVIGLSLPSVAPRKWIFSHILLPVAPKTYFQLLFIRDIFSFIYLYICFGNSKTDVFGGNFAWESGCFVGKGEKRQHGNAW